MTVEELLALAAEGKLMLGHLGQYSYVSGGARKTDAWEAHFTDEKGKGVYGAGRSARDAINDALHKRTIVNSVVAPLSKPRCKQVVGGFDLNSLD